MTGRDEFLPSSWRRSWHLPFLGKVNLKRTDFSELPTRKLTRQECTTLVLYTMAV